MNLLPKISLVTPSFNQAQFLEKTIQSILCQNYPNLEYIIIDGGSTDGSQEIIKKYESHLHYWCSEPDGGQYDAINKGFAKSTGEIMAWLNSDDMYCSWALRTVASIMSELPQVEWLTTLSPGVWDWHGFCRGFDSISGYSRESFLDGCHFPLNNKDAIGWIQQESTFWRRSLWEKVGSQISTEFKVASDFDLWSRFYSHAELYATRSPLAGFRSQANQRSRYNIDRYIVEAKISLDRMRDSFNLSSNYTRKILRQLKLHQLPSRIIRKSTKLLYGYAGKRIVRRKEESREGFWEIEAYIFH